MKKNIYFLIGFMFLSLLSFWVIKNNNSTVVSVSGIGAKTEAINLNIRDQTAKETVLPTSPSEPNPTKPPCKNAGDMCCKNKKPSSPLEIPSIDDKKSDKASHLEALEDPDDIVFGEPYQKKATLQQRFKEATDLEIEKTKDPTLGYVPSDRLLAAWEKTKRLQETQKNQDPNLRGALRSVRWLERGPNNIGGRTRAILVDLNDKTGNTVFAGSSTGGLFKVTDVKGSAKWLKVNDWLDNLTISSIAQDPKNPKVMYIGTGDSDDAPTGQGIGIYKSIDGGKTWEVLPTTSILRTINFQYVNKIIVTPDSSYVFASTFTGVYKSKDGGATWKTVLTGKTWDMARGSDGRIYAAQQGNVLASTAFGEAGTFVALAGVLGFPTNLQRVQIDCAPTNPQVVYIVGALSNNTGSPIYRSTNGGTTWTQTGSVPVKCGGMSDFTNGQAWYDLCIAVDPLNEATIWVGGIGQWRSANGGASWQQMTYDYCTGNLPYSHVDQHGLYFDPLDPSVLYLGNDGGVFRVTNAGGTHSVKELNNGYVTTQFYACALHPDSAVNHFLAGAQDNNSVLVAGSKGVGNGKAVLGGDGFYCFIDQNEPNIQLVSSQFGNWALSTNGGVSFASGRSSNSAFYTPSDYDSRSNILYTQTSRADLWRWKVSTTEAPVVVDIVGVNLNGGVSQVFVDPNVANRIYVGTNRGQLYRVDSAHLGTSLDKIQSVGSFGTSYISSIEVERGNANHILVCLSNYGIVNIRESKDGGQTWTSSDGNLPDMPIRWGIFNPNDATQAMIATETGVWTTELLNGSNTVWIPPTPVKGIPVVRTDMLQWRESDKTVLAATFGRGLWTTNVFGKPSAAIEYPEVAYLDVPVPLKGESSVAANNFLWKFSDNTTDTLENTTKSFSQTGSFDVSLTVNNDNNLTARGKVKILPNLPTPYKTTTEGYAGNFDAANWDAHFGAWSASGSKFVRGKSSVFGKDGTHSGQFAYVLAPNEATYQKGTLAYLHLPNYDMSQTGIYQFSFWANFDAQRGRDGLQVEYSLDKGLSWRTLGSGSDLNWYNYTNNSVTDGAFAIGESMITGTADDWTRFKLNISNLSGQANVAFRFVFKAANFAPSAGCAIDDVIITRYDGKNETAIISQEGAFTREGTSIDVKFRTQPEYFAQTFDLEISTNGRDWKSTGTIMKATGGSTEEMQEYNANVKGTSLDLYYFRVRSINQNAAVNYSFNFYSTPFVVKRNKDLALGVNKVVPSPFSKAIGVTFTDIPNVDITYDLFDVAGRLIMTQTVASFTGVYQELNVPNLPKAIYLLRVKIGENKPESFKLFGGE